MEEFEDKFTLRYWDGMVQLNLRTQSWRHRKRTADPSARTKVLGRDDNLKLSSLLT